MSPRTAARVAWVVAAVAIGLLLSSSALQVARGTERAGAEGIVVNAAFAAFAIVGALIVSNRPGNVVGRLFLLMGFSAGIALTADAWVRATPPLPWRTVAALVAMPAFLAAFLPLVVVLFVFPDGRLLSRRWRAGVWLAVVGGASLALGNGLSPTFIDYPNVDNPIGMEWISGTPLEGGGIGWLLSFAAFVLAAISVVVRYRRSTADDRRRLRWLMVAAASVGVGWVVQAIGFDIEMGPVAEALKLAFYVSILVFPILVGIAIVRQRLFDIDVVINRTVVYGALAAFITLVYVAIVVGVGSLLGGGSEPNVGLQVAATAVVAVAFQPVRHRVQRFANRLVFGDRATPYEVMTDFADRIAGTLSVEDVLPQMADAAARAVGARTATIRLFLPDGSERAVRAPAEAEDGGDARSVDVVHGHGRVGAIVVTKRLGEGFTPAEDALLEDVAAQAGLALRNVRLTLELRERLHQIERQAEQLRRSRHRLVMARDLERRRLERDISEGPRRDLERISSRLREAIAAIDGDGRRTAAILSDLETETGAALEALRDLARGIFPPLLADEGIGAALEAHLRKLRIAGRLESELDGARFDADVEAAVYFCCVQALQNAVRHAGEASVEVRLTTHDGDLVFSVRDDGRGFDPQRVERGMGFDIMHDRIEALGGTLEVVSAPGAGTTVTGRVAVRVPEAVAR